jgi:hypothetical protein
MPLGSAYTPDANGEQRGSLATFSVHRQLGKCHMQHPWQWIHCTLLPSRNRILPPQETKANNAGMTPESMWRPKGKRPRATKQHVVANAIHICKVYITMGAGQGSATTNNKQRTQTPPNTTPHESKTLQTHTLTKRQSILPLVSMAARSQDLIG